MLSNFSASAGDSLRPMKFFGIFFPIFGSSSCPSVKVPSARPSSAARMRAWMSNG
jgi:hypothetical protein